MYAERPFLVRQVSVEALEDDILNGLYGYWRERAGPRPYPLRSDILPEDMAQVLDRLALLEVLPEAPYFGFRLVGGTAQLVLGARLTGKKIDAIEPAAHAKAVADLCQSVLINEAPEVREIVLTQDLDKFTYSMLALPLSTEGEEIDRLLLAISWSGDQAPFAMKDA